jgi:hypothetical protein
MGKPRRHVASKSGSEVDYDLTCWYLNVRRVMELVGARNMTADLKKIAAIGEIDNQVRRNILLSILKDNLRDWLRAANPPTLGQLLITGKLKPNAMFTHYTNYFGKGLSQVSAALRKGHTQIPPAELYAKLDEFSPDQIIRFRFHHEHLTSASSWSELAGQRRLLVLGVPTQITEGLIEAIPWVIADPLPNLLRPHSIIGGAWTDRLEVHIDSIDNFSLVRGIAPPRRKKDLERLRDIPEEKIKIAFAEIIGERTIPKDWSGEKSDLFSSWVKLDGKRISTAFAFKGPAKYHPMTVADLGKNGDQIARLFEEPAELLILQHCHEITPQVRGMMRAYAQQMGRLRLFCLINGYDTIRLLQAYRKCGMSKERPEA